MQTPNPTPELSPLVKAILDGVVPVLLALWGLEKRYKLSEKAIEWLSGKLAEREVQKAGQLVAAQPHAVASALNGGLASIAMREIGLRLDRVDSDALGRYALVTGRLDAMERDMKEIRIELRRVATLLNIKPPIPVELDGPEEGNGL